MRVHTFGAALAVGLILASQATAQFPSNVNTRANVGNGFNFAISRLTSALFPVSSGAANAPLPIARPQPIAPRNTTLSAFLPKIQLPSAKPVHGVSFYPSQDQMPGSAYLKAFGLRRAPRVPID